MIDGLLGLEYGGVSVAAGDGRASSGAARCPAFGSVVVVVPGSVARAGELLVGACAGSCYQS